MKTLKKYTSKSTGAVYSDCVANLVSANISMVQQIDKEDAQVSINASVSIYASADSFNSKKSPVDSVYATFSLPKTNLEIFSGNLIEFILEKAVDKI